jgi:serine/threonine-protein kinase
MLWEMLAGRRLFLGDSDYQTVKLVQQANIPSLRKLNPDVPEALEVVIMRALARDKNQRYSTAQALAEDFANFLYSHQMRVTGFDVARIVREIVEEKKAQAKREGKRDGSIIDKLIQEELVRFTSLGDDAPEPGKAAAPTDAEGSKPLDLGDFINPSSWASELGDFDPGAGKPTSGWRESGLDAGAAPNLADELEGSDDLSPPQSPPGFSARDDDEAAPPVSAQNEPRQQITMPAHPSLGGGMPPMSERMTEPPPEPSKPQMKSGVIAVAAVVALAVVGAGLWLAGVFGH